MLLGIPVRLQISELLEADAFAHSHALHFIDVNRVRLVIDVLLQGKLLTAETFGGTGRTRNHRDLI